MAFNLKLVLKALLFSSSQPLTVKDIQTIFTRYHEQAQAPLFSEEESEGGEAAAPAPGEVAGGIENEVSAGPAPEPRTADGAAADDASIATAPADSIAADNAGAGEQSASTAEETNPLGLAPVDEELYVDVPSLVTAAQIREAMDELAAELKAQNDIYLLIDGAQGYRLVTHPRFAKWIRIQRDEPPPVKLTQSALETMAVVAYRQPVTRSEIEAIRGVSAEAGLAKLMERELVYIVGRADLPGRPLQYGTTDKFLEFVGVKSLVELPASDVLSPRQIDEWLNRAAQVTPPADAEMGLPLEEGEGESPSLEPVEIEHGGDSAPTSSATPDLAVSGAATSEDATAEDATTDDATAGEVTSGGDEEKKSEPAA